ncbi:acetylxylan esterase [Planctomyces sp. SH-PL62]|uniref:alpha/beta hydrolase family protein n=1 Tax=Planctomyces sp. SH-PL62 TaxID=1636152 RepID=UPI00078B29F0|nr:acetylxylan esterase [Planctomyces sp. SH-PL62]AMV39007.1 Acetyl xylan esterase (AXE1) [Planctomyces sp. SH-PL62]
MRATNDPGSPGAAYGAFIRRSAPSARRPSGSPSTPEGWEERLRSVKDGLRSSFSLAIIPSCDLAPEVLGVVERADYVIERLTFQSRPGVRVTANLYRPRNLEAPAPAVLCVHGHWAWARIDPVVQTRCIALARLGYVCLCVDAFGAGERAVVPGPGTYHGGLMGASLWAAGVPLVGLQVHDNRRAVDYLVSRPEVDPTRLAITGASGGGNQTLYAGALDDRLKAVVPVCGVGTLEAYLETACCVCEVNPAGLSYATTGDLLAMVAPRALLVVSASRDAPQFSAKEAAKSLDYARPRFERLGVGDRVRHVTVDSGHDYNQPMREALYGWLDRWLRERGDGGPVPEPEARPEDPALLRCFADAESRPASVVTIPEFVHRESLARLAALPDPPDHRQAWEAEAVTIKAGLAAEVLGGLPRSSPPRPRIGFDAAGGCWTIAMEPEPGLSLAGYFRPPDLGTVAGTPRGVVIQTAEQGVDAEAAREWGSSWTRSGYATCAVELRALGRLKPETPAIAGVLDHNEAEWGVWIGRPLLGQWVFDFLQWVEALAGLIAAPPASFLAIPANVPLLLHGRGATGTAAILASAYAPRIDAVIAEGAPVRLVAEPPVAWTQSRMGLIAPNLLKYGDLGRLVSLIAPRRLVVVRGVGTDGATVPLQDLEASFAHARAIYGLYDANLKLVLASARVDVGLP